MTKTHQMPLNPSLSVKDQRALNFIRTYQLKHGEVPTRQEIADALELSNVMAAQRLVQKLRHHGKLSFEEKSVRGLQLVDVDSTEEELATLPMLGVVAAGRPIEAVERNEISLKVPAYMIKPGYPHFALRVSGSSMIEDGIFDGDHVVVRQQAIAEEGQTVVALLDGEATLKRFHRKGKEIELRPANSAMGPIVVGSHQHLRILGVYVGLIRLVK
jgi:repressor LexA